MKILIVAKTRRGGGACVGGITQDGRSVRLIASDAATNDHAGLEYEVGEVWEIDSEPDLAIIPPHIENIIVRRARRLRRSPKVTETILRFMPPTAGGPEKLFDGLTQATASGGLYISERTGLPRRSTLFWVPDQPLRLDTAGKRLRYRYPTRNGGRTLTFVGFQEPLPEIPAHTLVRVSLAHWWRPKERPEEELRCFVQLSGWFLESSAETPKPSSKPKGNPGEIVRPSLGAPASLPASSPAVPASLPAASDGRRLAGKDAGAPSVRQRALDVLQRTFGFSRFLPFQAEVIIRILQHQDTLVVLPTGGGKSLCYQLPALLFKGLTVVVSPLVALMQDQASHLGRLGIPTACLNHTVPIHQYTAIMKRVRDGHIKLLYLAPETLLRPEMLMLLEQSRLACLAIDEAHCISEWGHDFRPEYRRLEAVRRRFPQAVCLALTATATPRVREDIRRLLGVPAAGEFVAGFNRPNLFLAVEPRHDALAQVLAFLEKRRGQSGIIYCGTRKQTDELCAALNANGWPALPYHAGLEDADRHRNQERFLRDETPLMVATIAFGMGINKPNVRFIIHAALPHDLESYYQEIGRAGRDGRPADCLLLYSRGDAMIQRHFIEAGAESQRPGREARLQAMMRFAEARDCRRWLLLAYFGETLASPCGHCDNCVQTPAEGETADATATARQFLSCVKLTGQMFGPAHIIAVLRGSRQQRVLARGHDRLSVFGAGQDRSVQEWRSLTRQFIKLGIVEQDLAFGSLHLTPKGWNVINGKEKVFVRLDRARIPEAPETSSGRAKSGAIVRPAARHRYHDVGERFAAGENLEQLAQYYGVLPETVLQNIYHYHESGGALDPQRVLALSRLPEPERARALSALERLGCERLAPVYDALSGAVPYQELHLLRLYLRCRGQT